MPASTADPPNGSSTGALWTAGLGAFLLIAAAATFVAVRWDQIADEAKLGSLVVITFACLLAHNRLRAALPLTATVLFHLGVLLVPIDVAAVGVGLEWTWSEMLLAQGLAATATFGLAAWTERSVVLRLAAWLGVVVMAAGIGGATGAPAGLVLAGLALVATAAHGHVDHARDGRRLGLDWGAAGWAALAGLAVPLSGAAELGWPAAGVLTDLGLATAAPHPAAAATGVVAGLVLGITAHRHRSLPIALLGVGCALTGLVTTWVGLEPSGPASLAAGAALLLIVQIAAWVWRNDTFWQRPTTLLAQVGELLTAAVTVRFGLDIVVAAGEPTYDATIGLAAALVALTWLVAEAHVQRSSARDIAGPERLTWQMSAAFGPFAAAVAASAAVTSFTGSGPATAVALTTFGGLVVLLVPALPAAAPARGDGHQILATHLLAWAPFTAHDNLPTAAAVALVGALIIAEAAVRATRSTPARPSTMTVGAAGSPQGAGAEPGWATPTDATPASAMASGTAGASDATDSWTTTPDAGRGPATASGTPWPTDATGGWAMPPGAGAVPGWGRHTPAARTTARVLALLSLVPIAAGALVLAVGDEGIVAAAGAVVAAWLVAVVLDRAEQLAGAVPLALAARVAGLVPLAFLPLLPNHAEASIAGLVAALAVVDALRRDEPLLLTGGGAAVPFVVLGLAGHAGWTTADAGVLVTLTGVAWLGLGACLPDRWAPPTLVSAVGAACVGLGLSFGHSAATATNLLLVGGSVAAVGAAVRRAEVATIGLGIATIGLWWHLELAAVTAAEPYVAPVALLLLVAGFHAQREQGASSWLVYAPALVLLGGSALLERLDGGPAWHALVAGAVGTAAVALGGARRLAGPLLVGTLLVVATTIHETLGVTTALGTPVWLAIGGLVLLAAGVAMERRGVGPVEAGRRLIDVVNERFA